MVIQYSAYCNGQNIPLYLWLFFFHFLKIAYPLITSQKLSYPLTQQEKG